MKIDMTITEAVLELERRDYLRLNTEPVLRALDDAGIVKFKIEEPRNHGAVVRTEKAASGGANGESWLRWTRNPGEEQPWIGGRCGEKWSWQGLSDSLVVTEVTQKGYSL